MAFSLSFGKNKTTSNEVKTTDQTQVQNQNQLTDQNQTETSNTLTSGASNTTGTNTGATQQSGTSQSSTTGQQQQSGTTSLFSGSVMAALEAAGLGALTRTAGMAPVNTSVLGGFNAGQFVSDAVTQAAASAGQARDVAEGGMADSLGGTARGNTMAALLSQQLASQQNAAVAGARNEATATAQGILRDNLQTQMAGQAQDQGFMANLMNLLRGGVQTTSQTGITSEQQSQATQQVGQEQSSQTQTQQQQQQTAATTALASMIQQLLSGTTALTGTESLEGTTSKKGGGFGLSL
jgi:hypothetical protein